MTAFGNMFRRLLQTATNTVQSKLVVDTRIVPSRNKHHQVPYFGAKNNWPQWSMIKDQRRRMTFKEYGRFKLRLNALRKNDILPPELKEVADHEIFTVPRDATLCRIHTRCTVTSRPRGNVVRWRVSRMIFKHLADYNKLTGVMRARW